MELLDVGGGFPTGQLHENAIQALKKTENDPLGYKVIAEPGRHFSANTCNLLFRVMTKRMKHGKLCYHVNESLYHSFNCILMDGISFENDRT
jgi:diaminopimelate decarboxylase